jgi:transcription factor IIIB subunit 2
MEKTAHMLIDFADALSVNVYTLGATFLKLVHLLSIKLPIVDPALYISRFADKLDYGTKTNDIVKDANRLASRMNRDWLQTGRRPAGICAAAIFIASRIHGFSRTHKEIVMVVKICENTLRKRLMEFSSTPSGNLTVTEFQTLWLEEERDPPAFTRVRDKKSQNVVAEKVILPSKKEELDHFNESDEDTDLDQDETLQDMIDILEREEIRELEANFCKLSFLRISTHSTTRGNSVRP